MTLNVAFRTQPRMSPCSSRALCVTNHPGRNKRPHRVTPVFPRPRPISHCLLRHEPMRGRPSTTGKMWTPLESRLPKSLLLTSRPGSAAEMGGGDLAGGGGAAGAATGGGTTTVGGGTAWEGEGGVGDSTVWCFPSWAGGRGSSGGGESHGGCGSDSRGGGRSAVANPQGRALFGRKPSPATVARSTSYAPR